MYKFLNKLFCLASAFLLCTALFIGCNSASSNVNSSDTYQSSIPSNSSIQISADAHLAAYYATISNALYLDDMFITDISLADFAESGTLVQCDYQLPLTEEDQDWSNAKKSYIFQYVDGTVVEVCSGDYYLIPFITENGNTLIGNSYNEDDAMVIEYYQALHGELVPIARIKNTLSSSDVTEIYDPETDSFVEGDANDAIPFVNYVADATYSHSSFALNMGVDGFYTPDTLFLSDQEKIEEMQKFFKIDPASI